MQSESPAPPRQGPKPLVWLLGALVAALFMLVVVLILILWQQTSSTRGGSQEPGRTPVTVKAGEKASREDLARPPKPPEKLNPDKISATFEPGRTYEMVVKGNVSAKGVNKSWGTATTVFVQYIFECAIDRTIESNSGDTLIEVRHYKVVRNAQVDAKVEEVAFDFGLPGDLVLGCLESYVPGSYVMFETIKPIAADLTRGAIQSQLDENAKVRGTVDSLSGKKVRLTFANGEGVTSIEPIGCDLSQDERDFIFASAVLADCLIMPDLEVKPGTTWPVDGQNLAGLIDPALRGDTSGTITIARREDAKSGSHEAAVLEITQGRVVIDSTTPQQYDIGTFTPHGKLVFDLEDRFVSSAELSGSVSIENCSRDHILYETSFRTKPEITINYTCKIR